MRLGGSLLTQADNSHPMAFWPLEAKRLGINFSNLSLSYPFFPFILPLLPPSCGSWSTCCSDNSLTLPQKTEKLKTKQAKQNVVHNMSCVLYHYHWQSNITNQPFMWRGEIFPYYLTTASQIRQFGLQSHVGLQGFLWTTIHLRHQS